MSASAVAALQLQISDLSTTLSTVSGNLDAFYLLMVGCLVFFMQAGFALLEAGSVRAKNTKNILLKNILDACIGAVIWWSFGYGVAYAGGHNGFIGTATDESSDNAAFFATGWHGRAHPQGRGSESETGGDFALWWFQYGFAAAAATIVSGAVAERCQLIAYLIYTCVITGLIYPVVVHWVWATGGWLSTFSPNFGDDDVYPISGGCVDFAGSGVVHMTGGIAALCGAWIIGPRKGRYEPNTKNPLPMQGHNSVLVVLGTFILWLGWYGFNPGSTLGIAASGYGQTMARVTVTTTLSAAAGGITVLLLDRFLASKCWDVGAACNGVLAGLVSITAGCATMTTWYSLLTGILGGFVYFGASKLLLYKLGVDDPLDAFAVHGACGFWGVFATGLFSDPLYTAGYFAWTGDNHVYKKENNALFFGGGRLFGAQVFTLFMEILWVGVLSYLLFKGLKLARVLRVPSDIEEAGMDTSKHGGQAYNLGDPK